MDKSSQQSEGSASDTLLDVQTETPTWCNPDDSILLLTFYHQTNGENWKEPWDITNPVSKWNGISLDEEGFVKVINLPENNLTGSIPRKIQQLLHVKAFNFRRNPVKADVYIANGSVIDEMIQYAHLTINQGESSVEEMQIKPGVAYVIYAVGADVYSSPDPQPGSAIDFIPYGEQVMLFNPLQTSDESKTSEMHDFPGSYVKCKVGEDTVYLFSGYLSSLPPPIEPDGYCKANLKLIYEQKIEQGFAWKEGMEDMVMIDEFSGHEYIAEYENGIEYSTGSYYEGGGYSVSFPRSLFSVREVFMFADRYTYGEFSEPLPNPYPMEPWSSEDNTEDYIATKKVEIYPDGILKSIEFNYAESGYVEDLFFRVSDDRIEFGKFGGS
ncbi:hypothetical protein ACFLS7_04255 [Bacteroidota bacterium]